MCVKGDPMVPMHSAHRSPPVVNGNTMGKEEEEKEKKESDMSVLLGLARVFFFPFFFSSSFLRLYQKNHSLGSHRKITYG